MFTETNTKSPLLRPYPSWSAHRITGDEQPEIVSPFRVRADRCGRLWVLDAGRSYSVNDSKVLSPPSLLVYDLHNDNLLRRFIIPSDQRKADSIFANIAVEDADCEDTFAYAADMQYPGLIVYSWKSQESWLIKHHFFHPDPLSGNFSVAGISFQTDGGLYGLSLSKQQPDGFAMLYFHPLSSTNEFAVSTRILRNHTLANEPSSFYEFKLLGSRGPSGQSGAAFLDQLTGVLFYTLPNLDAVACWKTSNREYTIKSQGRVFMSPVQMVYPNDVKVDDQDRLWVLSDRMQEFEHGQLDRGQINFRVLTGPVREVIENTACDITPAALPDIITRLGDILNNQTSTPRPSSASSTSSLITTIVTSTAFALIWNYK